jgi:hypothetical protein
MIFVPFSHERKTVARCPTGVNSAGWWSCGRRFASRQWQEHRYAVPVAAVLVAKELEMIQQKRTEQEQRPAEPESGLQNSSASAP